VDLSIERRAFRRFPLMLPVLFRWTDGVEHYDIGHCGNAGLGGMFILSARCPPAGIQVEIEVNIPAFGLVPHPVTLRCTGQVSRVETCYQLNGFAVAGRFVNEIADRSTSMAAS
jgi:hypothetical protein